jgi:hypothetical protein
MMRNGHTMGVRICGALMAFAGSVCGVAPVASAQPIQVGFLWHMHQPRYVPGQTIFGADPFFSFSVIDVHNQRLGPYRDWPRNAVASGQSMPHLGAHVSFSGSLIQNLNELEAAGVNGGQWTNWENDYRSGQSMTTTLGNRRLDLINFGFHHPLMALIDDRSIRLQIRAHRAISGTTFNAGSGEGLFPPETAFSTRMIPALVAEGIDWVMVDNIHFDRASQGYPHTDATSIAAPNRADQINPDPALNGGRWVQLQNLWAPSRVSVPFGYQPHRVQHVDPVTGQIATMTAVPAARYEGNEDGRGGYGAFLYDQVMDAYLPDNNAADRPMLVLLHHDGDNFGGGSSSYYGVNFQNMVNWAQNDPDYDVTTVDDYLQRFPVPGDALIHVEDGSWAGADAGDPEFKKWLGGDVSAGAVSPDINSWAALVAATNHVHQLDDALGGALNGAANLNNIITGNGPALDKAWHFLLTGQASDYWYWDGTEVWDSNVTVASNLAVQQAEIGLASAGPDTTPPTHFVPQREPYNPGAVEFGQVQPRDFEVWTLVHDRSGVQSVTLHWRTDNDGFNPLDSIQNETIAGGPEVGPWQSIPMTAASVPTPAGVTNATVKAQRYGAMITGQNDALIDYYVEAVDANGNVSVSAMRHVWVGSNNPGAGGERVAVSPDPVQAGQDVTVEYNANAGPLAGASQVFLHYGFNGWSTVISPDPAMQDPDADGVWELTVPVSPAAGELNIVFNDGQNNWDNNDGQDWAFAVEGTDPGGGTITVDGALDPEYQLVAQNNGVSLWYALDRTTLYLAATPGSGGLDRFIVVAGTPGAPVSSMWGKSGTVAAWDAFVGNEESNGWAGWFDASGATQLASGTVLEASIELTGELGAMPAEVHAAVLSFATADGGALDPSRQVPAGNADANVQANEYALIPLTPRGCNPADLAEPLGQLTFGDISAFLGAFNAMDPAADLADPAGQFTFGDISAFLAAFTAGCP